MFPPRKWQGGTPVAAPGGSAKLVSILHLTAPMPKRKRADFLRHLWRQAPRQYAVSLLLVGAAGLLTRLVSPLFDGRSPLLFFTLAVVLAAGYGGVVQGLFATGLSIAAGLILFQTHPVVLLLAQSGLLLFAMVGVAASILLGRLRRARLELSRARDELHQANQRLALHAAELTRSNGELERFAYVVAHDLKAPLRSITTMAELCLNRGLDAPDQRSRQSLSLVVKHAKRMSALIEDLLSLARIKHEQNDPGAVDLFRAAETALEYLREDVAASGAIIRIEALPCIKGSDGHFVRLFQNLLSNALKYRGNGTPNVDVYAKPDGAHWKVIVSDNGIGIDPRYHKKIFEPFQRLHGGAGHDGSGIGLAICKLIVEQQGGHIWVESAAGEGARFCFTVPVLEGASSGKGVGKTALTTHEGIH